MASFRAAFAFVMAADSAAPGEPPVRGGGGRTGVVSALTKEGGEAFGLLVMLGA